ncbi:hypothetical protein D3C75_703590 [compost metagenome]
MKRTKKHITLQRWRIVQSIFQARRYSTNLCLTWQENQQAASLISKRLKTHADDPGFDVFTRLLRLAPDSCDREHSPFARDDWRVIQQARQPLSFQRCRHQQHFQRSIISEQLATVECQRQSEIGIQVSQMEFVEDHKANALERRVALQAAREDTFGDHLNARTRANLAVQADAITHGLTNLLP